MHAARLSGSASIARRNQRSIVSRLPPWPRQTLSIEVGARVARVEFPRGGQGAVGLVEADAELLPALVGDVAGPAGAAGFPGELDVVVAFEPGGVGVVGGAGPVVDREDGVE